MRQFFIIGHNANNIADAISYLNIGANAIEPDIYTNNNEFYVGESANEGNLLLSDYLSSLTIVLKANPVLVPALMIFDTKDSDGNIVSLFNCINVNFYDHFRDTAIMISRSQSTKDEHDFFASAPALPANWALSVDEHSTPEYVDPFFKSMNISNYAFGDGISILVPLLGGFFKDRIRRAANMRDNGDSFKFVYSWTIDSRDDIESFLQLNPDGLITDYPNVLKEMIITNFSNQYQIATLGYNPFQ